VIYTITNEGLAELKNLVISSPEAPEFKKMLPIIYCSMLKHLVATSSSLEHV
jgi:hypothetical protein